jgi:hypothetical protein
MPDPTRLEKAQLWELESDFTTEKPGGKRVTVQFNPESLKVNFANQIVQPSNAGDQNGTPARQFVGAGTTKLSLQLWFDVNAPLPEGVAKVDDVRRLTQDVAYFITPQETRDNPPKYVPPAVRFLWGSFQFEGMLDSLEETLELFSSEGKPLRASMTLSLSQQKITRFAFRDTGTPPGGSGLGGVAPGTKPLLQAAAGASLQGLAAGAGLGDHWQDIASANGIENPRLLQPGQLIDLNVKLKA